MNRLQRLASTFIAKSSWDSYFLRNVDIDLEEGVVNKPYKKSDLVYICISTTARAISQVPLIIQKRSRDGKWEPDPLNPWQAIFNRPNYLQDSYTFVESIVGYLMLYGNCWGIPFPPGSKIPDSLWAVSEKNIKPIIDSDTNNLIGWTYSVEADKKGIPLDISEVSHVKFWNPDDPVLGQSPLEAGRMPLQSDYKAARYNETFFDEGAVPGGILSTEKRLTDPVFERTREQFEGRHQTYKRGHRTAVLELGLKYTQAGLAQKDMEFLDLRKYSRDTIIQIYGMKKAVIGITDGLNRATSETQKKEWWASTNIPIMRLITSALNYTFFKGRADTRVIFDLSSIAALQEELKDKVKVGESLYKLGFTGNEINERLELGFEEKDWRDTWYVPGNMIRVEDIQPPIRLQESYPKEPGKSLFSQQEKLKDKRGEKEWKLFIEKVTPVEKKTESKVKKLFFDMRKKSLSLLYKKTVDDLFSELFEEEEEWISKTMSEYYVDSVVAGGASIINELGLAIDFDLYDPAVVKFLAEKPVKIKGIVKTVSKQLREALQSGVSAGDSIDEIADRLRTIFNSSMSRARTIARTEIVGAANFGRAHQIISSGAISKTWYTADDERVRETHKEMHNTTILINENWIVGGSTLRYPGDYMGRAGEIINCFIDPKVPIFTDKGWSPISDIRIGDSVLTHKNRFMTVERVSKRRLYEGDVIKLYPKGRKSNSVTVTPNHRFLVDGDWKKAQYIDSGDKINVMASFCKRCGEAIPYWNTYCSRSCFGKDVTDRQWANPAHRRNMSEKAKLQMRREYDNGFRDRNETIAKAREAIKEKYGIEGYLGKVKNDSQFRDRIKNSVIEKYDSYLGMFRKQNRWPIWSNEEAFISVLEDMNEFYIHQYWVGNDRIDFYLPGEKLFVECDRGQWDKQRDLRILTSFPDHKMIHLIYDKNNNIVSEDVVDLLSLNHDGIYKQVQIEIDNVVRFALKKKVRLYNFAVDEDESYIARGFITHNCRCIEFANFEK